MNKQTTTTIGGNTEATATYNCHPPEHQTDYEPRVEADIKIEEVLILGDNIKDDLSAEKLESIRMECWDTRKSE